MNRPIRCKSCGGLLAQSYRTYTDKVKERGAGNVKFYHPTGNVEESVHRKILNEMGIVNECCAMVMLTLCEL